MDATLATPLTSGYLTSDLLLGKDLTYQ